MLHVQLNASTNGTFSEKMVAIKYTYRKHWKKVPYSQVKKSLQNHITENKNPHTVISNKNSFSY